MLGHLALFIVFRSKKMDKMRAPDLVTFAGTVPLMDRASSLLTVGGDLGPTE